MNWLKHNLAYVGAVLTTIYVIVIVALGFRAAEPLTFNEWGDYFAGFMSPVALAWLIGTLFVQRQELALQREEMAEARKVAKEQAEEQRKTAEANLKANIIADRAAFQAVADRYNERLASMEDKIFDYLTQMRPEIRLRIYFGLDEDRLSPLLESQKYLSDEEFCTSNTHNIDRNRFIKTLRYLLTHLDQEKGREIFYSGNNDLMGYFVEYEAIFEEFYERADETGSLILVNDENFRLAKAIRRHIRLKD